MTNKVEILVTATDKASAVLKQSTGGLKGLNDSIKAATGINFGYAAGLTAVVAGVKSSINYTMKYAEQVQNLSRNIGASTQEASRLIQVSDDVKLSVESLEAGLKGAIVKGYQPTIKGLAEMSDQYLAIQDPIQRSKFLVDTFGRAGLEMGKLMELGADGIKKMGEEAKMVLSPADIQRMNDFYKATDDIEDSVNSLKVSLALTTAGPLSKFLDTLSDGVDIAPKLYKNLNQAASVMLTKMPPALKIMMGISPEIEASLQATVDWNDALSETPGKIKNIGTAADRTNEHLGKSADYMYKLISYMSGLRDKSYTITQYLRYVTLTGSPGGMLTGAGGGGSRMGPAFSNAFGGSYKIPAAFGFEGASPTAGVTASGGERVTITPEGENQEIDLSKRTIQRLALAMRDLGMTRV